MIHRIPRSCESSSAVRLCAVHVHVHRADQYRARLGLGRLVYHWGAEAHPDRRGYILSRWTAIHQHWRSVWRHRSRTPWESSWYSGALCVHHFEGAWTAATGNGYFGGMQFSESSWLSNGGSVYASRADLATPHDQLLVAYHYWKAAGWNPWPNTARLCGLL